MSYPRRTNQQLGSRVGGGGLGPVGQGWGVLLCSGFLVSETGLRAVQIRSGSFVFETGLRADQISRKSGLRAGLLHLTEGPAAGPRRPPAAGLK